MFGKYLFCRPPLLPNFVPAEVFLRDYLKFVEKSPNKSTLQISIYRDTTFIHSISIPICISWEIKNNFFVAERIFKTCLWIFGGDSFFIHGCPGLVEFLQKQYSANGIRRFDADLIGGKVFHHPLKFFLGIKDVLPQKNHQYKKLRNEGNRIGIDLGGSDIKVVALQQENLLYSEEISWNPYEQTTSDWHLKKIIDVLQKATQYLPSIDSIGISIPGILVNSEIRISALFQNVPYEDFLQKIVNIRAYIQKFWKNIPITLCNDGDAAALFGGNKNKKSSNLLALSLGTSVAGGFVKPHLQIPEWFNELAFIPIDFSPLSTKDPWSTDIGCSSSYLSQQAVFQLATQENLIPPYQENTKKLEWIQEQFSVGNTKTINIFKTIGISLGYSVAYLHRWYKMDTILLLGRVCSKQSGEFLIETAQKTLCKEFPSINTLITWEIPKEESKKRMSQAIAATYLSGSL